MCERLSVYVHATPKARVSHKCCECLGIILPGETYHRHNGVFEGQGFTSKVCMECEQIRDEIDKEVEHWDDRVCIGQLFEHATERNTNPSILKKFVENSIRRGVKVPDWVMERYTEACSSSIPSKESQHVLYT